VTFSYPDGRIGIKIFRQTGGAVNDTVVTVSQEYATAFRDYIERFEMI